MPKLDYKNFKFRGISEGGVQTTVTVNPLDLAFDIGRCPVDTINIPRILLTHGHLDHAAGIPYFISQRALRRAPGPTIYMPPELLPDMHDIMKVYERIEGFKPDYDFVAAEPGKQFPLKGNYFFSARRTTHRVKSVGYTIFDRVKKLKPEFLGLGRDEIIALKKKGTELNQITDVPLISFSGDTQIEYILENEVARKSKVLFLECTYIDEARTIERTREWGHTHLDEIINHAHLFENEMLVLIHFSTRYSNGYIRSTLKKRLPESLREKVVPFI